MTKKNYVVILLACLLNLFNPIRMSAGTVTGQIQLASNGRGLPNGTLSFTLTQAAVVSGAATIVTSPVSCYTDSLGNVVGLPNPSALPVLSSINGSGSLPQGNYFVRHTWANSSGETMPGPEKNINTTQTGTLVVQVPVNPPANATQWKIYISNATGTETLQATQNAPFTNYSQSTALVSGAALPASNTSQCSLRFNDELQPSYTGYNVTLTTASGATVPGFPQKWYLSGGTGGTINVGNGSPLYNGVVVYPQPILSNPTQSSTQSINGPLNLNGFKLTDSNINGFIFVDGTNYTTVQQAITAVCAVGGGTVFIPPGTYPQNTPFTLCSNLNLIGAGKGQADGAGCVTTIITTMTSGNLFPLANMVDSHYADFCIKNTAAAGANAAIQLNYGQRNTFERLYISGLFLIGIDLETSSTSTGSTIWNDFRDIHITGLASNGIGCLLNSNDATTKTINNNYFWNVGCTGSATGGVGIKITNSNAMQTINENVFASGEINTGTGVSGGTGILLTSTATRGITFIEPNVESNHVGFNKATGNTVLFVAGNISTNDTNVSDSQPAFTSFLSTNVGGVVQAFSVSPGGDVEINSLCINSNCQGANTFNGPTGWQIMASAAALLTLNSAGLSFNKPAFFPEQTAPSASANNDVCYGDSTAHALKCSYNNGSFFAQTQAIGSGTATLGTTAISSNACAAPVTVSATGVLTSDAISWSFNADPNSTSGYGAGATGALAVWAFPTTNNVNFRVCNLNGGAITPGAEILNWRVTR